MPQKHYGWAIGKPLPKIGPHSLAKHRIIRRYVERYIEILTATSSQEQLNITFVDGYAGGGRYGLGRQFVSGSPLILLEAVASMEAQLNAQRTKGFRINAEFIFIDQNPRHVEFLTAEIQQSPFADQLGRTIHIWHGDFNERVDEAIQIARRRSPRAGRAIFLLDQYGWSQVAFRSVRSILNSLDRAEVFLTFSVDALINYLSENSYNMKAFGEIDIDPAKVREIVRIKESDQIGSRALIQNTLYQHVQSATGAPFYSPFFIKSPEASRSYWFIHLSRHREARNEIGMIHWAENNTTVHHGRAGLNALGFAPSGDIEQLELSYLFDEHAKASSREALRQQLPQVIHAAAISDVAPTLEEIFGRRCNDTPVVRETLEEVLVELRDANELSIVGEGGKIRPRTSTIEWTDKVVISPQKSFFGPFSKL